MRPFVADRQMRFNGGHFDIGDDEQVEAAEIDALAGISVAEPAHIPMAQLTENLTLPAAPACR